MTDWFVRPDTSHNITRNGQSYTSAWGGWSEIVWGTGGISAGDTLYVCDSHTYSANIGVGGQVATQILRITVRGDYPSHSGSITLTNGAFLDANRNYMTITNLSFIAGTPYTIGSNPCISPGGTPSKELRITNNTFTCGADAAIKFRAFNNWGYEDTLISGNTFNGGSGSTGGGCIQWYVTGAVFTTMKRLTISDNTFSGNTAQRATILIRSNYGQALETCFIEDLIVSGNTFQNCNSVALETEALKTVSSKPVGANRGIKVYDNKITNQGVSGIFGGGFALSGFELSSTPEFGMNNIYNNWCSGLNGITGFCNPLYGIYQIFNNYAENITTIDIDGCGILPDHGCHDTVIFNNEFRDIHGKASTTYNATGFGILILDASNITCYGNLIVNCKVGIGIGNKTSTSSNMTQAGNNIYNNTFINCIHHAVYLVGGANNTGNTVQNNIFTGNTQAVIQVDSATWTGESYNCFYNFGTPVNHTLATSSKTINPQLDDLYRPMEVTIKRSGVYLGGKDFYGRNFYDPPNIGAVEDLSNTKRNYLRKIQ